MGRKPNPLILEYFERGQKLNDSSNRYVHTCKACGEIFPKGRIDSLTSHLTKKCPAISEQDRINACLALHGINNAVQRSQKIQAAKDSSNESKNGAASGPGLPRDWTALETLAEVSRQIDLNDKHDGRGENGSGAPAATASGQPGAHAAERFEPHDGDNSEDRMHVDIKPAPSSSPVPVRELTTEEKLRALLPVADSPADAANLSMAAAAAARLNPSLLDPQLLGEEMDGASILPTLDADVSEANTAPAIPSTQPWGDITYLGDAFQPILTTADPPSVISSPVPKTGLRSVPGLVQLGPKLSRHSRARFNATRKKEVQEVRKLGACIRCRILRKTCSKGEPCDACRKVLSPRVWRSGCVRTKFSEQLDLYSAGVQIVLAQHRINSLKSALTLVNTGTTIDATHFPDTDISIRLFVLERASDETTSAETDAAALSAAQSRLVMIDNDPQDVPAKVEVYMRQALPELIRRETSRFMKVTLETATRVVEQSHDELLKKSIELWGLIEILDRERQWNIALQAAPSATVASEAKPMRWIREDTDQETFTTICLQLTAAAERKAGTTSKVLLTGMQRILQDSKTKVDVSMFFAALILLNCVEKSTWAFKAWEQENLRPLWPLEKEPRSFTEQGYVLAELLRMLLAIRRVLPRTAKRESDGVLITEEQDPVLQEYFQTVALNVAEVQSKQEHPVFSPTDPRSFEMLFCPVLLLPEQT